MNTHTNVMMCCICVTKNKLCDPSLTLYNENVNFWKEGSRETRGKAKVPYGKRILK